MVAADAQELVADDPDIPLIELVTQKSQREEAAVWEHEWRRAFLPWPLCSASGEALTLSAWSRARTAV